MDIGLYAIETMECDTSFCNTYREVPKTCYVCSDFQVDIPIDQEVAKECNDQVLEDHEILFNSDQVCVVSRTVMNPSPPISPGILTQRRLTKVQ